MIRFGQDEAHIRMFVKKDGISRKIDMHLKKTKPKGIAIDGIPIKRASELFGILNIVFFSPEDLNIIKSGPGERRRFMDLELCQLNKLYLSNLSSYNRVLNQRNKLLKDIAFQPSLKGTLDVWDEQLANYGVSIIESRKAFVEEMNSIIEEIHRNITGGKEKIRLFYEPSTQGDCFLGELSSGRDRDIRFKMTSIGPHRDDLCVKVNDIDIRKYGSQGQQRTTALAARLAEIDLIREETGELPVLLLDDVFSELDESRQKYLLESIDGLQAFVTCTGIEDSVRKYISRDNLFYVENGTIIPQKENRH